MLHGGDSLVHFPHLVCVEHQSTLRPNLFTHDAGPTHIVLQTEAYFQFEVLPAIAQRLTTQQAHLLIGVARPASTGCIGGKALLEHLYLASRFTRSLVAQYF